MKSWGLVGGNANVSKSKNRSNDYRTGGGSLGASDYASEADRPFAEIRKNLHDILRLLSLHRWVFFVPFCLATSGAFIASLYYPRTYSATTSFEVRNDPVMINLPMSAGAASYKFFRNTMVRDLTSVECMSEVVDNLKLIPDLERDADGAMTPDSVRRRDGLARSLGGNLSISTSSPSELMDVVRITYTGPDAKIGRDLVDEVKRTYIRRTMAWIHAFLIRQRDYFRREAEDAGQELLHAQRKETQLRMEYPLVNPADPGAISLKLSQLEMENRELNLRKREYETELEGLRQLLTVESPAPETGEAAASLVGPPQETEFASEQTLHLVGQLKDIESNLAKLRESRGMTDAHPDIQELLATRRRIEAQIEQQREGDRRLAQLASLSATSGDASPVSLPGPGWTQDRNRLMLQIAAQAAKVKELDISLATNERSLLELNKAKSEIFDRQEEFAAIFSEVSKAKNKLAQTETTISTIEPAIKAVEQDHLLQFSEGQPARGSAIPVSPNAATIVLLALVAGTLAGAVFVILAEIVDHVYRSCNQVARSLGLPILESIDEIVTGQDRRRFLVRQAVVSPFLILCCLGLSGLTGSMAYLSIVQPWTYAKMRSVPQAAIRLFVADPQPEGATPTAVVD